VESAADSSSATASDSFSSTRRCGVGAMCDATRYFKCLHLPGNVCVCLTKVGFPGNHRILIPFQTNIVRSTDSLPGQGLPVADVNSPRLASISSIEFNRIESGGSKRFRRGCRHNVTIFPYLDFAASVTP